MWNENICFLLFDKNSFVILQMAELIFPTKNKKNCHTYFVIITRLRHSYTTFNIYSISECWQTIQSFLFSILTISLCSDKHCASLLATSQSSGSITSKIYHNESCTWLIRITNLFVYRFCTCFELFLNDLARHLEEDSAPFY